MGQEKKAPPFINEYVVGVNYATVSNHNTTGKVGGFFEFRREFNSSEKTKLVLGFSYSYTSQHKDTIKRTHGNYYYDINVNMHKVYLPITLRRYFAGNKLFIEGGINFNIKSKLNVRGWSYINYIYTSSGLTPPDDLPKTVYTENISLGQPRLVHFNLSAGGVIKSYNKFDISIFGSFIFSGKIKSEFSTYSDNNVRVGLVFSTNNKN